MYLEMIRQNSGETKRACVRHGERRRLVVPNPAASAFSLGKLRSVISAHQISLPENHWQVARSNPSAR